MHQVCTLAQPARIGRAHCAQADRVAAVSWAVLQPVVGRVAGLALASHALHVMSRALGRVARLWRRIVVPSRPCRSIVSRHNQLPSLLLSRYNRLYRDTLASQTTRLSRYKDCIMTQPPTVSPLPLSRHKNCVSLHCKTREISISEKMVKS